LGASFLSSAGASFFSSGFSFFFFLPSPANTMARRSITWFLPPSLILNERPMVLSSSSLSSSWYSPASKPRDRLMTKSNLVVSHRLPCTSPKLTSIVSTSGATSLPWGMDRVCSPGFESSRKVS